jgi:hypothetical protein
MGIAGRELLAVGGELGGGEGRDTPDGEEACELAATGRERASISWEDAAWLLATGRAAGLLPLAPAGPLCGAPPDPAFEAAEDFEPSAEARCAEDEDFCDC